MPLKWRGSGDKQTLIRADQSVCYPPIACFLYLLPWLGLTVQFVRMGYTHSAERMTCAFQFSEVMSLTLWMPPQSYASPMEGLW